jgi:hypothetical protein
MRKTTGTSLTLLLAATLTLPLLAQSAASAVSFHAALPRLAFFLAPQNPSAYALIAGSVFRESGHAFPGVEVKLLPAQKSKKFKEQSVRTTPRGEFLFRLPAEAMEYEVSVSVSGYRPESKRVKIVGDERVDENFLLERAR